MLSTRKPTSIANVSVFGPVKNSSSIFHITDSEGSESFFTAINNSSIVNYDPLQGLSFQNIQDRPCFIFGGDVTDRGNNDLAITKLLVEFKKRYPENVFLLAGNREIIKGRFKIELAPHMIRKRLLDSQSPRWLAQPTVPLDYVKKEMSENKYYKSVEDYVNSLSIEQCQIIYLRWMLEKTMGCPHSFRYRREELAKSNPGKDVSDEEVLQSFLQQTTPDGVTGQYLQLAQVGVIVPGTGVLAVHGGLQPTNLGRIPGMDPGEKRIEDARLWIKELNNWFSKQIKYWIDFKPVELTIPACTELDDCILQPPSKPKSVITEWMLNNQRQFIEPPQEVSQYLRDNRIHVVLTGHQPCGDHPAILRTAYNALFINGDTGYAAFAQSNPDDTRGVTSHTLEIVASSDQANIRIEAVLPDKTFVTTKLTVTPEKIGSDAYVGRVSADNQLVQCRLTNGDYRLIQQKGFQVDYLTLSPADVEKLFTSSLALKVAN